MNDIQRIANHYGTANQVIKLIEEMGELTQAVSKFMLHICEETKRGPCNPNDKPSIDNMIEEIADVEIMLEQIVYLLDCREGVNRMKKRKINRTLDRSGLERRVVDE